MPTARVPRILLLIAGLAACSSTPATPDWTKNPHVVITIPRGQACLYTLDYQLATLRLMPRMIVAERDIRRLLSDPGESPSLVGDSAWAKQMRADLDECEWDAATLGKLPPPQELLQAHAQMKSIAAVYLRFVAEMRSAPDGDLSAYGKALDGLKAAQPYQDELAKLMQAEARSSDIGFQPDDRCP